VVVVVGSPLVGLQELLHPQQEEESQQGPPGVPELQVDLQEQPLRHQQGTPHARRRGRYSIAACGHRQSAGHLCMVATNQH
jgi:hypothetical protein